MAGLTLQGQALAQADRTGLEEVVVTGSRIVRNGYDSPVPVTVVDSDMINRLGLVNAQDVVRLMPQNIANQSDATSGISLSGNAGSAFANLRGLNSGGARTLTLVNGRRFVPSSDGGEVDLNLIPSVMIGRVETQAGGASAAYGSDAVAGVVNIILDDQFEGFKVQLDGGQSFEGDGGSTHVAAAYGLDFGGDRGRFVIGGEFQKNDGIERCSFARDWCGENWGWVTNTSRIPTGQQNLYLQSPTSGYNRPGSETYGQPNFILSPNTGSVWNSGHGVIRNLYRGAITSTTAYSNNTYALDIPFDMVNKVFTTDGSGVVDYDPGTFQSAFAFGNAIGGDNDGAYEDAYIQTPVERYTTYGSFTFDVTDRLTFVSELTYAERDANSRSATAATRSTMGITVDNAFLPADVRAALVGGTSFSMGKDMDDEFYDTVSADATVFRGLVGLQGDIGDSDWTWDAYYQYGDNDRDSAVAYSRNNDAFFMAIDAVFDPNNPTQIICRPLNEVALARLEDPNYVARLREIHTDCEPLNLFGQGNASPEAIAFAYQSLGQEFAYNQHVVAGAVQGTLAEGWAGPIGFAGGVEVREEEGNVYHGGVNPNDYAFSFGLDYAGEIEVAEAFVETNIPLFRDAAFGEYFELNAAIRYTENTATDTLLNQSRKVDATSWKASAIYDIAAGVRLRATQSRDIRSAGFTELFAKTAPTEEDTAQGRVNNWNIPGTAQSDPTPIYGGGNFTLTPEIGDTTTFGVVYTPRFLDGFQVSMDWFQIDLTDAITTIGAQRVVDLCLNFNTLCERLTFASPTDITRVDAGRSNVGSLEISGFDLEASYVTGLGAGDLSLRTLISRQNEYSVQEDALANRYNYAGATGGTVSGGYFPAAEWSGNVIVGWRTDRLNTTATVRYIGDGIVDVEWIGPEDPGYAPTLQNSATTNRVDSATYLNFSMGYTFPMGSGGELEVFGLIDNVLDKDPNIVPTGGYPTNAAFFDTFGRRWRAGVRVNF
jgi:outer membrane receptor protein involved in Fe transport